MILPMLIAPRGKRFHQFRFMLQLQAGSVHHKHGPLQSSPPLLHLHPQLFDYALTHLASDQFRQFLPCLTIATCSPGDLVLGPSFTVADQFPGPTLDEALDRRRQTPVPSQPLPDHQPYHHGDVVDSLAEIVSILLT